MRLIFRVIEMNVNKIHATSKQKLIDYCSICLRNTPHVYIYSEKTNKMYSKCKECDYCKEVE